MKQRFVLSRLLVFLLLAAMLVTMPSCISKTCRTINNLLYRAYSIVELTVTTEADGKTLTAVYSLNRAGSGISLVYDIESLAEIDPENPTENPIRRDSGTALVTEGRIVSGDGKHVDYPDIGVISGGAMRFDAGYFDDAKESKNHFEAKVKNIEAFYGSDVSAESMSVSVDYESQALKSVTVVYTAKSGEKVTAHYAFTV